MKVEEAKNRLSAYMSNLKKFNNNYVTICYKCNDR